MVSQTNMSNCSLCLLLFIIIVIIYYYYYYCCLLFPSFLFPLPCWSSNASSSDGDSMDDFVVFSKPAATEDQGDSTDAEDDLDDFIDDTDTSETVFDGSKSDSQCEVNL